MLSLCWMTSLECMYAISSLHHLQHCVDTPHSRIRNLDNPGLRRLQQAAISFHDNMDASFSIVYRGVLVFYYLNSYFSRVNHAEDDQMAARNLLLKLRIEVRRYFKKFTNDQNHLAVVCLFISPYPQNNYWFIVTVVSGRKQFSVEAWAVSRRRRYRTTAYWSSHGGMGKRYVRLSWALKRVHSTQGLSPADVDFKYSKDTPATYPQLKERIRDHSTIVASCEAISAWWQDYLGFCDALSLTTSPEDTTFLPSPERQLSLGMLGDHLFPYVHQVRQIKQFGN